MVERPIKKSERPAMAESPQEAAAQKPTKREQSDRGTEQPSERRDRKKSKGKGRGDRDSEERAKPANPALMRGPRPAQAKSVEPEVTAPEVAVGEEAVSVADPTEVEVAVGEGAVSVADPTEVLEVAPEAESQPPTSESEIPEPGVSAPEPEAPKLDVSASEPAQEAVPVAAES
jgi:hypothetical protein